MIMMMMVSWREGGKSKKIDLSSSICNFKIPLLMLMMVLMKSMGSLQCRPLMAEAYSVKEVPPPFGDKKLLPKQIVVDMQSD